MYNYVPAFVDNFANYDNLSNWTELNFESDDYAGSRNNMLFLKVDAASEYIRTQLGRTLYNFKLEFDLRLNNVGGNSYVFVAGNDSDLTVAANTIFSVYRSAANTLQLKDENQSNQIGSNITITEGQTWIRFKIMQLFFGKTSSTGLIQAWYKNLTNHDTLWTYIGARSSQSEKLEYIGLGGFNDAMDLSAKNLICKGVFPHEIKNIVL